METSFHLTKNIIEFRIKLTPNRVITSGDKVEIITGLFKMLYKTIIFIVWKIPLFIITIPFLILTFVFKVINFILLPITAPLNWLSKKHEESFIRDENGNFSWVCGNCGAVVSSKKEPTSSKCGGGYGYHEWRRV